MRINGEEFSFLHHVVDRQFVFLTADDDELRLILCRPCALVRQRTLYRESDVAGLHRDITQRRTFETQSRNSNGTLPASAVTTPRRQIDYDHQLATWDLHRSFPSARSIF